MTQVAGDQGRRGKLRLVGLGCLGLVVVAVVLLLALRAIMQKFGEGLSQVFLVVGVAQVLSDIEAPKDEAEAILRDLADMIYDSDLPEDQKAASVIRIVAVILARGFQTKYLGESGLSDEEKIEGHMTAARFARAVSTGGILEEELTAICKAVFVADDDLDYEVSERDTNRVLKKALSDDAVRDVLRRMKAFADKAGVAMSDPSIDLAAEIERAIELAVEDSRGTDVPHE